MKKNDKAILLAGVAAVGYLLYQQSQKKPGTPPPPPGTTPPNTTPPVTNYPYPIVYNKYHPDVKLLQIALGVTQDGVIGPQTLAAWSAIDPAVASGGIYYEVGSFSDLQTAIAYILKKKLSVSGFKTLG